MGSCVWGDEKGDVVLNEPCVKCGQIDAYVARGCSRCGAPRSAQKVDEASAIAEDVTTLRPILPVEGITTMRPTAPSFVEDGSVPLPPLDLAGSVASGNVSEPPPLPPLPSVADSWSPEAKSQTPRMDVSAEATLPSASPTVILTVLFGVFGAFMAASQTKHALAAGVQTSRYWKAFWITLLISLVGVPLTVFALFAGLGLILVGSGY